MENQTELQLNDNILIYVFGNGFEPHPELCSLLILTWTIQEYATDKAKIELLNKLLPKATKYAFSLPQVPSESWGDIAKITAVNRIEQMHQNKHKAMMLFEKKKSPESPDALLVIIFDPDESDLRYARDLFNSKEI